MGTGQTQPNTHGEVETLWNGDIVTHGFVEAAGLSWHYATTGADDAPPVVMSASFVSAGFDQEREDLPS